MKLAWHISFNSDLDSIVPERIQSTIVHELVHKRELNQLYFQLDERYFERIHSGIYG